MSVIDRATDPAGYDLDEARRVATAEAHLSSPVVLAEPMPQFHPAALQKLQFLETQSQDSGVETQSVVSTQTVHLPLALCDEQLLEELRAIPDRMGFKIGEVADLLGIKQYILRYWESEFDLLKPRKAPNNQRYYTRRDVENAFLIRKLLHRDRFSIEGAKTALKELRVVVKKEKDYKALIEKVEKLQERVESLIFDLQKLKQLFT
jgi:DNA-binding transcriptional MerR regulator